MALLYKKKSGYSNNKGGAKKRYALAPCIFHTKIVLPPFYHFPSTQTKNPHVSCEFFVWIAIILLSSSGTLFEGPCFIDTKCPTVKVLPVPHCDCLLSFLFGREFHKTKAFRATRHAIRDNHCRLYSS